MMRFLMSTAAHLVGNAVGLLLASILLDGFSIQPLALVIVVVIFTAIEVVASPLITKISMKNMPQLMGGVALVTTFVGLWLTDLIVEGFDVGGVTNWLLGTLIVWLGALIAGVLLPIYVFKSLREDHKKG
ncbi:phage holin family protein [Seohaeicola saemankumensis]|nr:phage holin family protein [Seohaeicola saemankumensis]MCA0870598.1 phage holin family protein [Seohaeicola saemankumensis]